MMCRAVVWLPDADRGFCEIRGEKLIDSTLRALRENHVFEVAILCRGGGDALEEWCRANHLELLIHVLDRDEPSGSAYRLFDARDVLVSSSGLLFLDGRVSFDGALLKALIQNDRSTCAIEFDTWDTKSPRASVERDKVVALGTSLTKKSSSGRCLGFYKFDQATLDEIHNSVAQQLAYSGDVGTSIEQVIDRLLRSRRIEMFPAPVTQGAWFLVDQMDGQSEAQSGGEVARNEPHALKFDTD
ncbi:MAG: hypothetical protein KDC95_02245 [Planctomycetes bacterium]|nr:hypothetical protein [Planctomycetota bacterium]